MFSALIASLLGICMVAYVHAQGTFIIDSSANTGSNPGPLASTGGLVYISANDFSAADGVLDTTQDINLGVLWGTTAATATTALNIDPLGLNTGVYAGCGNWITSQATGAEDITGYGSGALLDINGNSYVVPGAAAGTTIFLVLQGWTGNAATYAAQIASGLGGVGQTAPFSITLAVNSNPVQPDVHTMGSLTILTGPEPSIPALSVLSAAALLLNRRKK